MKKTLATLFATIVMASVLYAEVNIPNTIPGGEKSQQRIDAIEKTYLELYKKDPNISSAQAIQAVSKTVTQMFSSYLTNSEPYTVDDCLNESRIRLEKAAAKEYPLPTDAEMAVLAEKQFPLYKVGDRVKVRFCPNPKTIEEKEGIFNGERNGFLRIGQVTIRRQDMEGVKNNEVEMLKFDPTETAKKRTKFIRDEKFRISDGRKEFSETHENEILQQTVADFTVKNENAGFTCLNGYWYNPSELLTRLAETSQDKFADEKLSELKQIARARADIANAQADTVKLNYNIDKNSAKKMPANYLAKLQAAKQSENAEGENKVEEEDALAKARAEDKARQEAARRAAENEEKKPLLSMKAIIIIVVVFILIVAGVIVGLAIKKKRDETRFTRFFEGKGNIQKEFWAKADADPENFKYVTYLFPSEEEAKNALLELSYISLLPNGELKCSKNIDYGTYPHHGGAIAFIGGTALNYAPWREATATLPEIANATYFKVSTEPVVRFEMPNIQDQNLDIKDLGRKEVRGEDGSFLLCYMFQATSKDDAMTFLEKLNLEEEGVMFQVETPEGFLGKDMEGIFQMDEPVAKPED